MSSHRQAVPRDPGSALPTSLGTQPTVGGSSSSSDPFSPSFFRSLCAWFTYLLRGKGSAKLISLANFRERYAPGKRRDPTGIEARGALLRFSLSSRSTLRDEQQPCLPSWRRDPLLDRIGNV